MFVCTRCLCFCNLYAVIFAFSRPSYAAASSLSTVVSFHPLTVEWWVNQQAVILKLAKFSLKPGLLWWASACRSQCSSASFCSCYGETVYLETASSQPVSHIQIWCIFSLYVLLHDITLKFSALWPLFFVSQTYFTTQPKMFELPSEVKFRQTRGGLIMYTHYQTLLHFNYNTQVIHQIDLVILDSVH